MYEIWLVKADAAVPYISLGLKAVPLIAPEFAPAALELDESLGPISIGLQAAPYVANQLLQVIYQIQTFTKTKVANLLTRKASSTDITSTIAGKADKFTTYTKTKVDSLLQQNKSGSFKFYDYIDPGNVYSGGVISHPTKLIFCRTNTSSSADDNTRMSLDDTYAFLKGFIHILRYTT